MKPNLQHDVERLRAEYARRERDIPPDFYALWRPANLFMHQRQARALLRALRTADLLSLKERALLDVGRGPGPWLAVLEELRIFNTHYLGVLRRSE